MNVVMIGGYFEGLYEGEIVKKTKGQVEFSANNLQRKLLDGFKQIGHPADVISAPYIGAFPQGYRDCFFRGFSSGSSPDGICYVPFCNVWGLRNFSRARAVKKELDTYCRAHSEEEILLIVYATHTPFVKAAAYAKKKYPHVRICLIAPDLPQYMNLSAGRHLVYDLLKKGDIASFYRYNKAVDTYVLLTDLMKEVLRVGDRPYIVAEGVCDTVNETVSRHDRDERVIVYAGKLNTVFGVKDLVEVFCTLPDPQLRLTICGTGELADWIREQAARDRRICFKGQVTSQEARKFVDDADILVNPRKNNCEYTKYSFPSKNIEYLSSGNAVVAHRLDGMPSCYEEFMFLSADDSAQALKEALCEALAASLEQREEKVSKAAEYFKTELLCARVCEKILQMSAGTFPKEPAVV